MSNNSDYSIAFQSWLSSIATAYRGILPSGDAPSSPYIVYEMYIDRFGVSFIQPLKIYCEGTSDVGEILKVVDKIDEAVGDGGCLVRSENVNIFIRKGSPFYQDMPDDDENIKAGYVNLEITIYQKERC